MRKFPKHTQGTECEGCNERLKDAHILLQSFFSIIKDKHPSVHISWVYRDEESQKKAVELGASKLPFPKSKHNKLPAEAIDIFQINENGKAVFDPGFCRMIFKESEQLGFKFTWGGSFKSLGDYGHFELSEN